ncbi:ATP-dependent zinc metalloprotease FtsH [bacterium]|nr:ATP-dependent zinc metalloprotease FtsH [bacterium]
MKFMMGRGNGAGGLLNIKVGKKPTKDTKKTKFTDIAGMEEVKQELMEVVDYLKNPDKYKKVGARHPKGVLLYGEPGSGKTLLARAVAGESEVLFLNVSGSEFMEMLVGMGAAKVRTLFKQAKDAGKAIIFIDEIDAIGRKRGAGHNGANQEQEQTLNQILTEMDGFDNDTNIIVMAATNRPDILDPALLRAGRFDRKIYVTTPTAEERTAIFEYYLKGKKISPKVKIESLTKRTSGLVGADIENIVNEASLKIAKDGREILEVEDFEYALEKVIMGPEKKVKGIQEKEKKLTAFHELGHALLAHLQDEADPVEKISIVRRGHALGVTRTTPTEDKNLYSKQYLLSELSVMLAGRAAEEIFFGPEEITTGAANDFERATQTVRNILTKFGMDEELGMVVYKEDPDFPLLKPYSEETAQKIDRKIKEYLDNAYQISKKTITKHKKLIEKIAAILVEKEFITGEEFAEIVNTFVAENEAKKSD